LTSAAARTSMVAASFSLTARRRRFVFDIGADEGAFGVEAVPQPAMRALKAPS